jgi:cell division topological specificity factor
VIDFFRRLFGHSGSSSAAKERLRLVLMTDHLELSPDIVESMKRDLVDVISRYVEVDREKIDVSFERQDKALAMLANIPIIAVNRSSNGHATEPVAIEPPVVAPDALVVAMEPPADGSAEPQSPATEAAGVEVVAAEAAAEPGAIEAPPSEGTAAQAEVAQVPGDPASAIAAAAGEASAPTDLKRRRRRRKRKGAVAAPATETVSAN